MRVSRWIPLLAGLAVAATACPPPPAEPPPTNTIVVTTTDDVSSATDGLLSLREAFARASGDGADSVIVVTGGATYQLTSCAQGQLLHDEPNRLTVTTTGAGRATVQQTCPAARVMVLTGRSLVLEHLAVRGGRMGSPINCTWPFMQPCNRGAGIDAYAHITLRDVEMFDNLANRGPDGTIGGALVAGAGATIEDSSFHDNVSDRSGGAVASYGDLVVRRSNFTANRGLEGNAIAVQSGTALIEDSVLHANTGGSGGAIVMRGSSLTIRDSELTGNNSGGGPGAAIWVDRGAAAVVIERTDIVANTGRAGAMTSFGGVADYRVTDSNITDNVATMSIRDQYNASAGGFAISGASALRIEGSVVSRNSAPAGGGSNFDLTPSNGTTITLVDTEVSAPLGGGANCALRGNAIVTSGSTTISDASCVP